MTNRADRIFLTGATGFVGSHVLSQLLAQEREIVVLSRSGTANRILAGLECPNLSVVTGDLLEPDSFVSALADCGQVVHIAGVISFAKADEARMHRLNYDVTHNLWEACVKTSPDKILYLGSIFALGRSLTGGLVDEDVEFDDQLLDDVDVPYLHAKRRAELLSWEHTDAGRLPITFGYPGACIGPRDYNLSSMHLVQKFMRGRMPVYIQGGIHFVDVRDAADGLIRCLDRGEIGERYIIGGYNLTWSEFFGRIAAIVDRRPPRPVSYRVAHGLGHLCELVGLHGLLSRGDVEIAAQKWFYDSTRSLEALGLSLRPFDETLRDGIAWIRESGL
jgi:dihydroflavonol-4-reductase